jgi:two-component system, chemotaxis family, sensor kinase CheA
MLVHAVRNAIDHGIEPAAERATAGKRDQGLLVALASKVAGGVRVVLADDGRGVDVERVRARAVELGLLDAAAAARASTAEILDCLFAPGFSTARAVTELSGRGVGLDVVRAAAGDLGGRVELQSVAGRGCRLVIEIPDGDAH